MAEKAQSELSKRLWTVGLTLITFGLGVSSTLFWDRVSIEHRTASMETAITDVARRVTALEATNRSIAAAQQQIDVNTKRLDQIEQNGSSVAKQAAADLAQTSLRLARLETTTQQIAITESALVTSDKDLLTMQEDVKRLAANQVSEREFQAVKDQLEEHEADTSARLTRLDDAVNKILTMMAEQQKTSARNLRIP